MSRANLKLAPVVKRQRPTFAQLRRALRLFDSEFASREARRANALKWLRSIDQLGTQWVLAGRKPVTWGAKQK